MTRDELIALIESGETGHDLNVAIAKIAIPNGVHVPSYTTSIDAAVALIESSYDWEINKDGCAFVNSIEHGGAEGFVKRNPAAALILAWLRVTNESYSNVATYDLIYW